MVRTIPRAAFQRPSEDSVELETAVVILSMQAVTVKVTSTLTVTATATVTVIVTVSKECKITMLKMSREEAVSTDSVCVKDPDVAA